MMVVSRVREMRPAVACRSKPVAMTVTLTSSLMESSMTAPKMMLQLASAALEMTSAASLTSNRPRSGPPVMLSRMPVAPSTEASSSGDEMAALADSEARFSPLATPMPMSAEPASFMMALTSAKSRLMRPGTVIRSVMPWTPCLSTSSATLKASMMEVRFSTT